MLGFIKKKSAVSRMLEEQLYEVVVNELASGQRRNGLWAKAVANSEGQNEKAKALYIQYRVQSLKDEYELLRGEHISKKSPQASQSGRKKENNILQGTNSTKEGATFWIHILVWSIAGIILLVFFAN